MADGEPMRLTRGSVLRTLDFSEDLVEEAMAVVVEWSGVDAIYRRSMFGVGLMLEGGCT